jgi:hypothetical protein
MTDVRVYSIEVKMQAQASKSQTVLQENEFLFVPVYDISAPGRRNNVRINFKTFQAAWRQPKAAIMV